MLEGYKKTSEALEKGLSVLSFPEGRIAADALLKIMVHTVASAMATPRTGHQPNEANAIDITFCDPKHLGASPPSAQTS